MKEILRFDYVYGRDGVHPDPAKTQKQKKKVPQRIRKNSEVSYKLHNSMLNSCVCQHHPTSLLLKKEQEANYQEIIGALESAGALYTYNPDLSLTPSHMVLDHQYT